MTEPATEPVTVPTRQPEPVPGLSPTGGALRWTDLDRGWRGLVLETDEVSVTVLPDKGCDIYAFVDRATDIDVLWKTPWGLPARDGTAWSGDSATAWLERYPGGWQVLCPNGGAASPAPGGVTWGFHGEACLLPWTITASSAVGGGGTEPTGRPWVELSVRLQRAPVRLNRRLSLSGSVLTLTESVTNTSPDPLEIMWSHHPAFGAPLVEPGARITSGARRVVADDGAPGTDLAAGSEHPWPAATAADGTPIDLSVIPSDAMPRATFAYLTDMDDGWFAITNPVRRLGVGLRWDAEVFEHAWFWQEMHASPGFPWYGEVYVMAIEPFSSMPGHGLTKVIEKTGTQLSLPAGQSIEVEFAAVLYHAAHGISGIDPDGTVGVK